MKVLRYMKQYPAGTAFTEDDIIREVGCSPGRLRWALTQLSGADLIQLARTVGGDPLYLAADCSDRSGH
jgi:hypothetical protein